MNKNGFRVRMQSAKTVEMEVYGVIGGGAFFPEDDFVNVAEMLRAFRDMGEVETLSLFFNSPGGDVYDGFQLANRLDKLVEDGQVGTLETNAEGIVASAATLPFLKGTHRRMRNGSRFMIHKPWTVGMGTADDFRAAAQRMDQTESEALDLYESISSLPREELAEAMSVETYYTPSDAKAAGFATEVVEPLAIAACMSAKLREKFSHLPSDLEVIEPTQTPAEDPESFYAAAFGKTAA